MTMPRVHTAAPDVRDKLARLVWSWVWLIAFRPSPVFAFTWRRMILRMFGARISDGAVVYPSTWIWAPWNLVMGEGSCLAADVDCYSVATVTLEARAIVSQRASLVTASHDHRHKDFLLTTAPILIASDAWVAAEAFVGPGVTVGAFAVVGARCVAMKDVRPHTVMIGNPARVVGERHVT